MKTIINIAIGCAVFALLTGCYQIKERHKITFYKAQSHDVDLVGQWSSGGENVVIWFNADGSTREDALSGHWGNYWYTKDGYVYLLGLVPLSAPKEKMRTYSLSEDKTVLYIDRDAPMPKTYFRDDVDD